MKKVYQPLIGLLLNHFVVRKSTIIFMAHFIIAMIQTRTVNLVHISNTIKGKAKPESHYKRLKRFIKDFPLTKTSVAKLLAAIMLDRSKPWILAMDRTNWKLGKVHLNILYLAVANGSIAVPLFWKILSDKKSGNSDYNDRIKIMEDFTTTFGKERIHCITADREFIGKNWLEYLQKENLRYVIRVKEKAQYITGSDGKFVKISGLCAKIQPGEIMYLISGRKLRGSDIKHKAAICKNENGSVLALIYNNIDPEEVTDIYRKRWSIEVMFKHFKTNGFNLEDTHVTQYERLFKLISIMAIAFAIAYKLGYFIIESKSKILRVYSKPIVKKHGRKSKSIFRLGLDAWNYMINNFQKFVYHLNKLFKNIEKNANFFRKENHALSRT